MLWDAQNWDAWLMVAFDRKGKLWKVWEFQKKWSETFNALLAPGAALVDRVRDMLTGRGKS